MIAHLISASLRFAPISIDARSLVKQLFNSLIEVSVGAKHANGVVVEDGGTIVVFGILGEPGTRAIVTSSVKMGGLVTYVDKTNKFSVVECVNSFASPIKFAQKTVLSRGASIYSFDVSSKGRNRKITEGYLDATFDVGSSFHSLGISSLKFPLAAGSPLFDETGCLLGIVLSDYMPSQGRPLAVTIEAIRQCLWDRIRPDESRIDSNGDIVLGRYARVLYDTGIHAAPNIRSRKYYSATQKQYLVVRPYSREWLSVLMQNHVWGYALSNAVEVLPQNVVRNSEAWNALVSSRGQDILATVSSRVGNIEVLGSRGVQRGEAFCGNVLRDIGVVIPYKANAQFEVGCEIYERRDLIAGDCLYFTLGKNAWLTGVYIGYSYFATVDSNGKCVIRSLFRKEFDSRLRKIIRYGVD